MLQVITAEGDTRPGLEPELSHEDLRKMYRHMLLVRRFSERGVSLQRQGRVAFFIESTGQEACQVGSAYALTQRDWVFPTYRDPGMCLVKGVPLSMLFDQILGNAADVNKGRQMGVHWGFRDWNVVTLSSPIATQLLHAVGTGMAANYKKDKIVCLTSVGDGGTSQGEFHAAMNFAGVFKAPVVFLCENNQYAISLPVSRQTASKSIAMKAEAYGFEGFQIDGNDVLAVYKATKAAVDKARRGDGPTLIEAVTYRMGGHSTSDDPSKYRSPEELEHWKKRDPISRFSLYLLRKGVITEQEAKSLQTEVDEEITRTIKEREKIPPPSPSSLFTDVYSEVPWHLKEESDELAGETS